MGIVRSTYAKCQAMKQILRTLMVKFEERDVFMSFAHQQDIRDRMQNDDIEVPQLFVDGQYIGVSISLRAQKNVPNLQC
jgi:glutaredoxin